MSRRPARFTQAEIARAIAAVKQSGEAFVIEVTLDGAIRLFPFSAPIKALPTTVDIPALEPERRIKLW
jgi:hypothetical protein